MFELNYYLKTTRLVFIYGASGVGKTTISKYVSKKTGVNCNNFETDLIREIVRGYSFSLRSKLLTSNIKSTDFNALENYSILCSSTKDLTIDELKIQSRMLIMPLIFLCEKLKNSNKSAIIEGVNIPICDIFSSSDLYLNFKDALFVNLYSSDPKMHLARLNKRSAYRNSVPLSNKEFEKIRIINDFYFEYSKNYIGQRNLPFKIISLDTTPTFIENYDAIFELQAQKIFEEL